MFESEKYSLNERELRLGIAKRGASLVGCFSMGVILLTMFLLTITYNFFLRSMVRTQILQCLLSFAFGTVSTALMIGSSGGIFAKGVDIGADTYGKL